MPLQIPGARALSPAVEADLQQFNKEYVAVFNAGNAPALAALFAEDAVVLNTFGVLLLGRTAIEVALRQTFAGPCAGAVIQTTPQHTRQLSKTILLQQGMSRTIRESGPQDYSDFSFTKIFVRHGGRWFLAVAQFARPEGAP